MLLTTCPNCSAQFKVQPEQLNIRQGRVMCGRCRDVFNAFQSLTRIEEPEHEAPGAAPPVHAQDSGQHTHAAITEVGDRLFLREEPPAFTDAFSTAAPVSERLPAIEVVADPI